MLLVSQEVVWVVVAVVVDVVVVAMVAAAVEFFFLRFPFFLSSQVHGYQGGCRPLDAARFLDFFSKSEHDRQCLVPSKGPFDLSMARRRCQKVPKERVRV